MDREVVRHLPGVRAMEELSVPLSPAVRHGNVLYVSGQPPLDWEAGTFVTGTIEEQTVRVLANMSAVLVAGGSSLEQVLKTTVFCTDSTHFPVVNEIYARYFPVDPPARSWVPVGAFPFAFDIEIECIAAIS